MFPSLNLNYSFPSKDHLQAIVNILKNGGVIVHPSDTCYGLAGRADLPAVRECIDHVKNRTPDKFYSIAVSDLAMAHQVCKLNNSMEHLIKKYLPGRITLILPGIEEGTNVGLRIPKSRFMRRMIQALGHPIITTSANMTSAPSPYTIEEAQASLQDPERIALWVDAGPSPIIAPSTVIDCTKGEPVIVRKGSGRYHHPKHIPLRRCVGLKKAFPKNELIRIGVSGNFVTLNAPASSRGIYLYPSKDAFKKAFHKNDPCQHYLKIPCIKEVRDEIWEHITQEDV